MQYGKLHIFAAVMTQFDHDIIVPYKDSALSKSKQVEAMFDDIAPRYDFLNRFLSSGIDVIWRKKALKQLITSQPKLMLDVATGTADLAIMAAGMLHPDKITGIDISEGMLNMGRKKINKLGLQGNIELLKGNCETINFESETFDAVTVAFGVRNFQHLEKGLGEILRVLKPGGKLLVLEFSKPRSVIVSSFYSIYMKIVAPNIGKLFSKNKSAYQYLDKSIQKFPEGKRFIQILDDQGYKNTYSKSLSLGICSIYCGEK